MLALAGLAMLGGCQVGFALLEKMFPKERVGPQFKLPPGKKVLVFPDDIDNPITYSPLKRTIAEKTSQLLQQNHLAAEVVPYDRLLDLQVSNPDFNGLEVATVGRRLSADLVIYVVLDQFGLKTTPEDTLWSGVLSAKVRVVDVTKGKIWPTESAGFSLKVTEPEIHNTSEAYGEQLARQLGERLAEEIAGLFHEHYVERSRPKESDTLPPE
jgi:hypothetical protein